MLQRKQQSETPDLEELQAFVAIAAQGSLTGAARRLGLPKSTVSRRLSRLEEKVGVALVHRTTRRLSLTESGLVYRERVAPALAALDEARSALREQHETPRGHLRVTAPFDLGLTTLAPLVGAFLQRWPETSVEVLLTERLLDLVEERIDLAVRAAASLPDSSLSARRLAGVSLVLVATPQHLARHGAPPSPDGLAGRPLLLNTDLARRGRLVLHGPGGPRTLAVKAVLAASDFTFLHEAALAHAGIAVQPDLVVQGDLAAGRLVRVLPEWNAGTAGLYAVHPAGRVLPARVRAFRDLLVEHFSHA